MSNELIPTRATLLQRLKDLGDQASWRDFFETYWALIYGVAVKGGLTPAEAEDVVQDTMVAVAKHIPEFKYDPAIGSFKGWLLTTTRWRITDQLRRRGPVQAADSGGEAHEDGHGAKDEIALPPDLEQIWDAEWESNILNAAVTKARRRLDPQQYQIFDCYVNRGWEAEKVAKAFSVPVGQVYVAKHRVTEAIRLEVERLGKELI